MIDHMMVTMDWFLVAQSQLMSKVKCHHMPPAYREPIIGTTQIWGVRHPTARMFI